MTWRRTEEDTLLPLIATVQVGCVGTAATAPVDEIAAPVSIVVPGFGVGLVRTNATITTTITARPAMIRYGVRGFFFFRTTRQFGQTVRLDSMDAPQ
jgi:hypothetical protein